MPRLLALLGTIALAALAWWGLRAGDAVAPPAEVVIDVAASEPVEDARRVALEATDALPALAGESPAVSAAPVLDAAAQARAARFVELNRMAIRALEAGDPERACALFEQCVKGVPDEPVFARNLAEALARAAQARREREQPCASCVTDLERALALAPERDDLARLLERWRKELHLEADFWRERSAHFELAYDGDRADILHGSHRLIDVLERAYEDLGLFFGILPVEQGRAPIRVVLHRREGFGALTGLGDWAGGAFDGTVRVPIEDLAREERRLESILRHELVHAFVLELGGAGVPGWLNEGLAQFLEPDRERDVELARAALAGKAWIELEELRGSLATWDDQARIAQAYAQSLALVDHLARHYGERIPVALVAGCAQGKDVAATFREWTRVDLAAAAGDLAAELAR